MGEADVIGLLFGEICNSVLFFKEAKIDMMLKIIDSLFFS